MSSSASSSYLLFVSISTCPFFSDLKVFIPTLTSVGFILVVNRPLIVSGGRFSFDFTVSLNLFWGILLAKAYE